MRVCVRAGERGNRGGRGREGVRKKERSCQHFEDFGEQSSLHIEGTQGKATTQHKTTEIVMAYKSELSGVPSSN